MSKLVNGRKPLSSKPTASAPGATEDIFGNPLAIPPDVEKDLKEQGLVGRWVNAKELHANQGYHKKGWIPYKRKPSDTMDSSSAFLGNDPSGIVRRGDCILAYKKKEDHAKHKDYLAEKSERYSNYSKKQAEELRDLARSQGIKTKVEEGYEEDGDLD